VKTLEHEFIREKNEITENHSVQKLEWNNFIATILEEWKVDKNHDEQKHKALKEAIKNKDFEAMSHMKIKLEGTQKQLNNELEGLH